jgi:hypothetical protein
VDTGGQRYYFGMKNIKPVILKPWTETFAEVWVDLDDGPGTMRK